MFDNIKVFKSIIVKNTKRNHQCYKCGKIVKKNSKMINITYSYDNRLVSVYKCLDCDKLENKK